MPRLPWRRKPFKFLCPLCGNQYFSVTVRLVRRRFDRPPDITSIGERLRCTDCGFISNYQDFIDKHRGWL